MNGFFAKSFKDLDIAFVDKRQVHGVTGFGSDGSRFQRLGLGPCGTQHPYGRFCISLIFPLISHSKSSLCSARKKCWIVLQ